MRDLARSVASFTWAMSLFGFKQMANLMSPQRAADAFGAVARSAEGSLGPGLRNAYETGDRLQKAMLDASFSLVGVNPSPNRGLLSQMGNLAFELLQLGVSTVYTVTGTAWRQQQGAPGWGRVEPPQASNSPRP